MHIPASHCPIRSQIESTYKAAPISNIPRTIATIASVLPLDSRPIIANTAPIIPIIPRGGAMSGKNKRPIKPISHIPGKKEEE